MIFHSQTIKIFHFRPENYLAATPILATTHIIIIKYIASLIVLFSTIVNISIASLATAIGAPVGIASASFSFAFSITTGIVKKLLKTTQNKKKKHSKIVMLLGVN